MAPVWGSTLELREVRGNPALVYTERPRSLLDLLDGARRWGEREHLVDDIRRVTFTQLLRHVDAVAAHLAGLGVEPGDRVLLLARNSIEWVVTFWAAPRLGAVAVLGNAWWAGAEARGAVAAVGARLVFADAERAALLAPGTSLLPVAAVTDLLTFADAPSVGVPVVDEDDPAVILFTSGTTGEPKGAVLSHRSIIANQQGFLARTKRLPSDLPEDHPATTSLLSTPLFHVGGLQALASALITGGRLVFTTGRFDPARVLALIERERITVWGAVPTMIQRVVEHPDVARRDLSSVRAIGLGGAPLPPQVIAKIPTAFPNAARGTSTNYGATEAGGIMTTAAGSMLAEHPGTSGRPLPHVELRLGEGEEILARSSALMTKYWGEPDSPIDADGWLHTGDIGRIDADGCLYVVGRIKDVIIRGGENIAAPHVELALATHPAVAAAAVIGVPHPDLGEEVGAVVVLRPGLAASPDELVAHLAHRVARFEVPSHWWFRTDPLPENATGKVDKPALRRQFPSAGVGGSPGHR
jgi:long-chain acyl-CoA synthetase